MDLVNKLCHLCMQEKPLEDFPRNRTKKDGRGSNCKNCKKKIDSRYREENRSLLSQKEKEWRNNNKDYLREYRRQHVKQRTESTKRWKRRNPEKAKAHQKVRRAIITGKLTRLPCEKCENPHSEAHHDDYSKPLEVRWLCRQCHVKETY